jgi:hypothetical protein
MYKLGSIVGEGCFILRQFDYAFFAATNCWLFIFFTRQVYCSGDSRCDPDVYWKNML